MDQPRLRFVMPRKPGKRGQQDQPRKGAQRMTTYRLLWLDKKGNTPKSAQLECHTDRQAIEIAEHQTGDYGSIEVWEGSRFICHCDNPDSVKQG